MILSSQQEPQGVARNFCPEQEEGSSREEISAGQDVCDAQQSGGLPGDGAWVVPEGHTCNGLCRVVGMETGETEVWQGEGGKAWQGRAVSGVPELGRESRKLQEQGTWTSMLPCV